MAAKQAEVNPNVQLIEMMKANTKKERGLGFVWNSTTAAVGTTFGALNNLAEAGNQLAISAKRNAVMSNLENSKDICELLGIEAKGLEQLTISSAIVDYICSH